MVNESLTAGPGSSVASIPFGATLRVSPAGAGGGGRSPPPSTPLRGRRLGHKLEWTLYHPIYSDPGGPVNRCGTTVCVPDRSGRFPSCPQLCPNKESTTFRRRGLTPVFERLFREAVERVGELVTDLLTGEVG